jgi:hypothetical protein
MIRHLKNSEIDYPKWDACVANAVNGLVYASSWYLDLVHDGWEALVENDYERVMPLTRGKKFGVEYLHQPFFTQQLGVFSKSMLHAKTVKLFIENIPAAYKFCEINLNSFNKVENVDCEVRINKNHILDLINEYPKIAARYSTQTKRNLKKSQQHQLTLMKNIKPEIVINLFRENRGRTIEKWKDNHYQTLNRLMHSAIFKRKGMVYGVFTQHNELTAGAFFLNEKNRLTFLFSGSNEIAKQTAAMTFLIDSVIREHTPKQMVLDFEGSNDVNLARFYKGFGAKEIGYPAIRLNKLSFPARQLFTVYKKIKKA